MGGQWSQDTGDVMVVGRKRCACAALCRPSTKRWRDVRQRVTIWPTGSTGRHSDGPPKTASNNNETVSIKRLTNSNTYPSHIPNYGGFSEWRIFAIADRYRHDLTERATWLHRVHKSNNKMSMFPRWPCRNNISPFAEKFVARSPDVVCRHLHYPEWRLGLYKGGEATLGHRRERNQKWSSAPA